MGEERVRNGRVSSESPGLGLQGAAPHLVRVCRVLLKHLGLVYRVLLKHLVRVYRVQLHTWFGSAGIFSTPGSGLQGAAPPHLVRVCRDLLHTWSE
ncbi:unnamed protein product [Merluccius merluccius]